MIIDTHLHTWDTADVGIGWLQHAGLPPEAPVPDDDADRRYVLVEADADDPTKETDWLVALARHSENVHGVVAGVRMEEAAGARLEIERIAQLPEVLGVRRLLQDRDHFTSRQFSDSLSVLSQHGLPFDACVRADELPALIGLLEPHDDLTVVLDHMGKPPLGDVNDFKRWQENLQRLAQLPHVYCKLSGLPAECRDHNQLATRAEPVVTAAYSIFGPGRCMVGSDRPVSQDRSGWCDRVLQLIPEAHRDLVAHGTAEHVYAQRR